ncbi:MAG: hypothetical protein A2075_20925 [Geobacteraceae bacterium GWC2_58_44]|nr:MAG: hypothetical protein A2075_20925 [Geobacteraceae bacterium GWC2_58_44]HBG05256.1 hypothetical protein [Geobacter sp.]
MKPEEIFSRVVGNAFDFLGKALAEFEKEPKYSVINFHAAVELFLKARLMREHWSLVVSKPEIADWKQFISGDFHSVTIREARTRLDSIVQDGISQQQYDSFLRLTGHRNRMVHFFHQGQHDKKSELQKIVAEQCRAWYYLHQLLSHQWAETFTDYQKQIKAFDKEMRMIRHYLKAKFEDLTAVIADKVKGNVAFHKCPSCGFKSLQEDGLEFECLVCDLNKNGITLSCPQCAKSITMLGEPWQKCTKCGYTIEPDDVKAELTKDLFITKHNMYDLNHANCGDCEGYETIVEVDGQWFCTQCFTRFEISDISQCGWCNEYTTGDQEDSYWRGCGFCDGKSGWDSDKDKD